MWLPVFPAPLIIETVFSPSQNHLLKRPFFPYWVALTPLGRSVDHKLLGSFLDLQFHCLLMAPTPVLVLLMLLNSVSCESSHFAFSLFQDCFSCSESLRFCMNFRISLSTSAWKMKLFYISIWIPLNL